MQSEKGEYMKKDEEDRAHTELNTYIKKRRRGGKGAKRAPLSNAHTHTHTHTPGLKLNTLLKLFKGCTYILLNKKGLHDTEIQKEWK